MELDAVDGLGVVCYSSKWCSFSPSNDMEVLGEYLELVSMGHPDL